MWAPLGLLICYWGRAISLNAGQNGSSAGLIPPIPYTSGWRDLAEWHCAVIQLYHAMGTLVTRLWRALVAPRNSAAVPPGGVGVLPAYAALARSHSTSIGLDPRFQMLVTHLAAERSRCRWCIERGRHLWCEAQLPVDSLR